MEALLKLAGQQKKISTGLFIWKFVQVSLATQHNDISIQPVSIPWLYLARWQGPHPPFMLYLAMGHLL